MEITEDKYIEILEIQGIGYNKNSKWFKVSLERINEAINYTRSCKTFYCGLVKRQEGEICENQCGGCADKEARGKQ